MIQGRNGWNAGRLNIRSSASGGVADETPLRAASDEQFWGPFSAALRGSRSSVQKTKSRYAKTNLQNLTYTTFLIRLKHNELFFSS